MYRIAIVGDACVGKSALCVRIVSDTFVRRYEPTIEEMYLITIALEPDTDPVALQLADTPGLIDYASNMMWAVRRCDAYALVVTTTERSSVTLCAKHHWPAVKRFCPPETPYIVALNKDDVERSEQLVDESYIVHHGLTPAHASNIVRVSAKTGAGVKEMFAALVAQIDHRRARIGSASPAPSTSFGSASSPRSASSSHSIGSPRLQSSPRLLSSPRLRPSSRDSCVLL